MTPIAVERDSRTFKQAASLARLGYRSIVFEGEASALGAESPPFELVTMPNAEPTWGSPASEDGEHADGADGRSAMSRVLGEALALRRQRDWNRSAADAMPDGDLYLLHSYPLYLAVRRRSRDQSVPYAYDAHDSYFELYPDQGGPWQRLWAWIERRCVQGAAGFATVSEGLADLLEERQGRRPEVIRNAHDLRLDQPVERDVRAAAGVSESDFLVVCVGNDKDGMTVDRALLALTRLPDDVHLACVGRGHEHRRARIAELGLEGRVHLVGPAPPTEIVSFIAAADAAAVLYRPLTRTYLHALPNGFFQSIAAGLPILYPAELTDLALLAERHGLGQPIHAADPASIADGIEALRGDPELRRRYAAAAETARETENWEHEEPLLAGYIDGLLEGETDEQLRRPPSLAPPPQATVAQRGPSGVNGVLLLYHRPTLLRLVGDASNVTENIAAFPRMSRFPVHTVNTALGPPPKLEELDFDAIVFHYSVFVYGPTGYFISGFEDFLRRSRAYKIATFQDEHHWTAKRFKFLNEYGIDCIFTMLEEPHAEQVYGPRTKASRIISNLPGYVGPELLDKAEKFAKPDSERRTDVGYRGRKIAPYMGRGGLEKYEIGKLFAEHAAGLDLTLDIEIEEQDRLYGDDWYRFVTDCKAVLGVESGVSCFDIEDEVMQEYSELIAAGHEPTIEELEAGALGRWDGNIPYRTISPRHFEAAALRVCQILYEGHYSGAMEPMRHYIPLRKDFSNFDEVIERFRDPELRRELTENAYEDLIASGDYDYEKLIAAFDGVLVDAGLTPAGAAKGQELVRRGLHRPLRRRARHYATGLWGALAHNFPGAWKVLHYASRPLVVPIRRFQRRRAATS